MNALAVSPAAPTPQTPDGTALPGAWPEGKSSGGQTFEQLLGPGQGEAKSSGATKPGFPKISKSADDQKAAEEMAALLAGVLPPPAPLAGPVALPSAEGTQENIFATGMPEVATAPSLFSAKSGTAAAPTKASDATATAVGNFVPTPEKNAGAALPVSPQTSLVLSSGMTAAPALTEAERMPVLPGTSAAMQRPVMSKATLLEKPATAPKAAAVLAGEPKASAISLAAAKNGGAGAERENKDFSSPQSDPQMSATEAASGAITFEKPIVLAGSAPAAVPEKIAPAVTTALHQVLETADRMRSDGRTHVEMQIKLHDGQELTIKLQMQDGTVRPVFKTESTELRQALEQSWSSFSSSAADRGLKVTTPVFEASNAQPGLNNFANRDSRRQARDFAETDGAEAQPNAKTAGKTSGSAVSLINAPFSRIQRYA